MRKLLLINLSPRLKGTSFVLAQMCREYLDTRGHSTELIPLYPSLDKPDKLYAAVREADTLVFSGPCYTNTYPADTILLLERLSAQKELLHGQSLYGLIQGGMPYAHTHESGLRMLELFCKKNGLTYKGGFVMGLGAILNGQPISQLPNSKKVTRQLGVFFNHIEKDEEAPRKVYEASLLKMPAFVYGMMAKKMNQSIDKDLLSKGIDIRQPSPYLAPVKD